MHADGKSTLASVSKWNSGKVNWDIVSWIQGFRTVVDPWYILLQSMKTKANGKTNSQEQIALRAAAKSRTKGDGPTILSHKSEELK